MIRLCTISSLVVAVILGIGKAVSFGPALELDGIGLSLCAGINLGACWLAFVPIAVVSRRYPTFIPQASLAATGVRMLIVVTTSFAASTYGPWPVMPLTIWMVIFYLSLLAVETVLAVRLLSRGSNDIHGCTAS